MAAISAEKSTNEILSDIYILDNQDVKSDFSVMKISQAIKKLLKVDAADSYMLEGILNTVLWKEDDMISYFEKALKIRVDYQIVNNYAISLKKFGLYDLSMDRFSQALRLNPASRTAAVSLLNSAVLLGEIEKYSDVLDMYYGASNDNDFYNYYKHVVSLLRNIEANSVRVIGRNIVNVLKDFKKDAYSLEIVSFGDENVNLSFQVSIENASLDDIYFANEKLNEFLCFSEEFNFSDAGAIAYFVPYEPRPKEELAVEGEM